MVFSKISKTTKKVVDLTMVFTVGLSLVGSMINPTVAQAEAVPAVDPKPFEEPVVLPPQKEVKRTIKTVATAYSSEVGQTDSTPCIPAMWKFNLCENFTKNGLEDTIAANFLPLGTEVRFPDLYGDKVFVVRDRMNSKYNGQYRIDFWKSEKPAAVKFGVQRVKMEVLK